MPKSEADKRAANKYIKEHMTVLGVKVRKEDAARYHALAADAGTTVNAILKKALVDFASAQETKATE